MTVDTLLYDGECPMCQIGARVLKAPGVRIQPYQQGELPAGVSLASCQNAMQLVRGGDSIASGAGAWKALLDRRIWTRPLGWAMGLPGAMAFMRWVYELIARNRRAIAPTPRNVRLPPPYYRETPGVMAAFVAVTGTVAAILTLAYGASAAALLADGRANSAVHVTGAATAGWIVSLPLLIPLVRRWIVPWDVLRHGAWVAASSAALLVPVTFMNFIEPSAAANMIVLACDGLFMLAMMARRLGHFGAPAWPALAWFTVLISSGMLVWGLL